MRVIKLMDVGNKMAGGQQEVPDDKWHIHIYKGSPKQKVFSFHWTFIETTSLCKRLKQWNKSESTSTQLKQCCVLEQTQKIVKQATADNWNIALTFGEWNIVENIHPWKLVSRNHKLVPKDRNLVLGDQFQTIKGSPKQWGFQLSVNLHRDKKSMQETQTVK